MRFQQYPDTCGRGLGEKYFQTADVSLTQPGLMSQWNVS